MTMLNSKIEGRKSESGNVLFLILIAVALFAALSYAVTQSTRSGGGDAGRETTLVNAASITQYPASVKTAITRMVVSSSIDPNDLKFDPPSNFAALTTDVLKAQSVFYPTTSTGGGGGASYVYAPANVMESGAAGTWHFNGANEVQNIGLSGGGATEADVIAFLPNVKQAVCQSIHAKLGLSTSIPDLTAATIDYTSDMDVGSPNITGTGGVITDAILDAQPQGCFEGAAGVYVYYHVLVER